VWIETKSLGVDDQAKEVSHSTRSVWIETNIADRVLGPMLSHSTRSVWIETLYCSTSASYFAVTLHEECVD